MIPGKPPIGQGDDARDEWRTLLAAAAANPLTHAKVSGLYASVGSMESWTEEGVRPFVEDALELFGPARLMWGSDWPVCLLVADYETTFRTVTAALGSLSEADRAAVLGGNAMQFYRIG